MSTKSARREDIERELPACLEHLFDEIEEIAEREALRLARLLIDECCSLCRTGSPILPGRSDIRVHNVGPWCGASHVWNTLDRLNREAP